MLSLIFKTDLQYPPPDDAFSPDERFPEYRFDRVSGRPNPVYRAVREALQHAGLDRENFGKDCWNPLGAFAAPGQRVFVLCNFVYHRRSQESLADFFGKCTHGSLIRALVDYLLIAVGPTGRVRFGNAPLQGAIFDRVTRETHARDVADFYQSCGAPVELRDLRLHVAERNDLGWITSVQRRDESGAVAIDLDGKSLLAALDAGRPRYRVLDYDPDRTQSCHAGGRHVYLVSREVIDADLIVSIPKLKTHEKVGITCALKGCVGAIGHKDCLAHHRLGSPERGDEYPGDPLGVLTSMSFLHERIQKTMPETIAGRLLRLGDRVLRKSLSKVFVGMGGAWWGNDTCWRMTADIARIIAFADHSGTLGDRLVRRHLALIDGVMGGEGDGPLNPRAVQSGMLLFSDNPVEADYACALFMGYDPDRIPLIREALRLRELPLIDRTPEQFSLLVNGTRTSFAQLKTLAGRRYAPPRGWVGQL